MTQPKLKRVWRILVGLAFVACAWPMCVQAQCNSSIGSEGYTVRDVELETLFGRAPAQVENALKKHRGDSFVDNGNVTLLEYFREVKDFFSENSGAVTQDRRAGINQQKSFYVRATFIRGCVKEIPKPDCLQSVKDKRGQPTEKCVDITLKIKVVPIHTESVSANLLDLARSNRLRFYRELPAGIRIFNPSAWVENDRDNGATAVINSSVNLLGLAKSDGEARNTELQFLFSGRKSLQKKFYDIASSLYVNRERPLDRLNKLALNVSFIANEQPFGNSIKLANSFRFGATTGVKLDRGPINNIKVVANYRFANNRLHDDNGILTQRSSENALEGSVLLDGSIARGFLRGAVWFDGASRSTGIEKTYQRLAATVGYAKDIVLPHAECRILKTEDGGEECLFSKRNAPRVGVELLFGAGRAWGHVPDYARFFGGNSPGNFLYDAVNAAAPDTMPTGPLIRSFGINKAGVRTPQTNTLSGGKAYWHGNISVAFPMGNLSRPLIPAELVSAIPDDEGHLNCSGCTSLKKALKNQIAGEKNIFIDAMAVRGMTDQQREDLALDPDDPDNPLTDAQLARLKEAERVFELQRQAVTPQADRLWERITPAIEYIADHANLYDVRPLVMMDAARITDSNIADQRTRIAVGGGIQFNVVVAKFEVGYLRTVRAMPGDQKGNFVIRMLFEKLF